MKIDLDPDMIAQFPLRLGLSTEVTVDLHNTNLPMIPESKPDAPLYSTDVFAEQESGAEGLIREVIAENLSPTFLENEGDEE